MKIVLIILAVMAGLALLIYIPWLIGGAAVVIFCFWNEWYVAGVIAGLFAIFMQVVVGGKVWEDHGTTSDSGGSDGFGMPEMFAAYKFGEHQGKKKDD